MSMPMPVPMQRFLILVLALTLALVIYQRKETQTQTQTGGKGSANHSSGNVKLSGWFQDPKCNYEMIHVLQDFINRHHIKRNDNSNWELYIPCGYNNAEAEYHYGKSQSSHPKQKIFIIKGCDNLSRKDTLWEHLEHKYHQRATSYMPRTYILYKPSDLAALEREYHKGKVYILKKNIQRQEGLKITRSLSEIKRGLDSGFVIAQEMLQDPYMIDGRKTNCRCYLLVVCQAGRKDGYLYSDGFMYYTPKPFQRNSTEYDRVITAGLATKRRDNQFYQNHPLTLTQFQQHVYRSGHKVDIFLRIGDLLHDTLAATHGSICDGSDRITFQLFGCDVAFNDRLEAQLMEINKGPDLTSKTAEESRLKRGLMESIFHTIGMTSAPAHREPNAVQKKQKHTGMLHIFHMDG